MSIQAQVAVETVASKYVTVTTRQPEIVNTALLNGKTVTSQLYYSVIGNDIAVRNLSSPTQAASKIVEPTLLSIQCSSSAPATTLKVAGRSIQQCHACSKDSRHFAQRNVTKHRFDAMQCFYLIDILSQNEV